MQAAYLSAAFLLLSTVDPADGGCPPGSVERVERVAEGTLSVCIADKGIRIGPYTLVDPDGVTLAIGQYESGRPVGRWQTWYSNSARHEDGSYTEGKRSGLWTRWHPNGQKAEEGAYRAGDEQGVWRVWDDKGALVSSIPRSLECPAPLVWRAQNAFLDLHPGASGNDGQHCRRADGVPQGPAIAWGMLRRKLAMTGSYCGGHAQGRWSFFGWNGVLVREGSFTGPSRKHGAWADYDASGRKLIEIVYADGRELSRHEYPRSQVELAVDTRVVDRIAVERYDAVLRQTCTAAPTPLRPYRGLREELRAADAVVVVRVTGMQMLDRPPGWLEDMPPTSQRIDATVKKVLAGSLEKPGTTIQLWLATAEHRRRFETLPGSPEYLGGVSQNFAVTALVKRNGDRLEILNLLAANEGERTAEFFTEYARLAVLDDRAFMLGLARHLADRIRMAPDRLLWVRWATLAMDDWTRLPRPSPSTDPKLRRLVSGTLATILTQIDAFTHGRETWLNLFELPWLIRLLAESERRELAAALLRVHPILVRELEEARKAGEANLRPSPRGPRDELTFEDIRQMSAAGAMMHLMECLAFCVNPEDASRSSRDDTLARARAFVRNRGPN